jgi:hypothetical protein
MIITAKKVYIHKRKEFRTDNKEFYILLLSEDDIINEDDAYCDIRGYNFDLLLIPKRMKELFKKTKLYAVIRPTLVSDGRIEYY